MNFLGMMQNFNRPGARGRGRGRGRWFLFKFNFVLFIAFNSWYQSDSQIDTMHEEKCNFKQQYENHIIRQLLKLDGKKEDEGYLDFRSLL